MPNGLALAHGVMEGEGAYNKHAKLQAGGAALALLLLEKVVEHVALDSSDQPVVIADYGSSQGKNSLVPVGMAIKTLRRRLGAQRPIFVYHVDLPPNDFTALFEVVNSDPSTYVKDEPNVFPCAIGQSFYRQVLPDESVHLGWSSYAAVWLSKIPMAIPGHFSVVGSRNSVREAFDRQGALDWRKFLTLRAKELRPGGRMIVVLPALNDDRVSGFESLFDRANEVLAEMVQEGTLKAEERKRMVLGAYYRRKSDILEPFEVDGQFQDLTVRVCDLSVLQDAAWCDYERFEDKEALARKHALFFRATFMPSLATALTFAEDPAQYRAFGDRLEVGLRRRLSERPAPVHSFVQTVVLSKRCYS